MRIRTHTNPLGYTQRFKKIDTYLDIKPFTRFDLEIGFGQATFIIDFAKQNPTHLIVGAEVKKKTVDILHNRLALEKVTNVIPMHGNGQFCLNDMFEPHSVDNIFIFHPDPWKKHRHSNRRVINQEFLTIAAEKIKPTGKLYISTDVEELWQYMLETIMSHGSFALTQDPDFWNTFYATRWSSMCKEKQRTIFYGTFVKK